MALTNARNLCHRYAMSNSETLSDRVAEEIRAMLARRRMSGRELARKLDVSSPWVSNRLTGHQEIGLAELERIAAALGVEVAALLPAPAEASRKGGLSPGSAHMSTRPRAARLMEVAHRGGHAPPSANRTNGDAANSAPIGHSRAPVRLCAGVTR